MKPTINLHNGETMLFECRPKKALIPYLYFIRGAHTFFVMPIVLGILYSLFAGPIIPNTQSTLMSALATFGIFFVIVNMIAYAWVNFMINRHWYFFTDDRCIIYSGYWGVNKKIIPYNRIVDINLNRNPLRAIFGLTAIYIIQQGIASQYTRGMGKGTDGLSPNMAIIEGLSPKLANKIADLISAQMSKSR